VSGAYLWPWPFLIAIMTIGLYRIPRVPTYPTLNTISISNITTTNLQLFNKEIANGAVITPWPEAWERRDCLSEVNQRNL